jgi:hypothetical protein
MKYLYLLSGCVGVGKDTCADIIVMYHRYKNSHIYKQAMADPLKTITLDLIHLFTNNTCDLTSLNKLKDEKDTYIIKDKNMRDLLYDVSISLKKEIGTDIWVNLFMKRWLTTDFQFAIVPDVRYNELELFKQYLQKDSLIDTVKLIHIVIKGPSRNRNYQIIDTLKDIPCDENSYSITNDSDYFDLEKSLFNLLNKISE